MNIVILAAGMGQRMRSTLPKVLHPLAGRPLISHVLETACALSPTTLCVVIGHGGQTVRDHVCVPDNVIHFVSQIPQQGTGHAVLQAASLWDDRVPTLVLYGDVPLIGVNTLERLVNAAGDDTLALLTVNLEDPTGYGRIVRSKDHVIVRIVEQKDACQEELAIQECNTGILIAPTTPLKQWLSTLSNDNAQREYYLTDIVATAATQGTSITSVQPDAVWETFGVNNQAQLTRLERLYQHHLAEQLLAQGVALADHDRIDIRGTLRCGQDCRIDVGCVFEGEVTLADGVHIGPHCVIKASHIGKNARIQAFCHVDQAIIHEDVQLGPYARLRAGTVLEEAVHIGNFVEVKNSTLKAHSKANHLSYLGDAMIGERVNIGAGVITCNYDGANKFRTVIEDDAFIGSDTQLVAPVRVGKGATLGAGTTLTKNAPEGKLTVSRVQQVSIDGWMRPVKKR